MNVSNFTVYAYNLSGFDVIKVNEWYLESAKLALIQLREQLFAKICRSNTYTKHKLRISTVNYSQIKIY